MKKLSLLILALLSTTYVMSQTTMFQPDLINCSKSLLESYKSVTKSKVTLPSKVTLEQRIASEGDPAVWSQAYMVKIAVPYGTGSVKNKSACYLLDKSKIMKVSTAEYSPIKGRLLKLKLQVATSDMDGNIGSAVVEKLLRINQINGSVTLE
jgi:hypothetical protein